MLGGGGGGVVQGWRVEVLVASAEDWSWQRSACSFLLGQHTGS